MFKRVFLVVLDGFGVGELPDANDFLDKGSNTLLSCYNSGKLNIPNMQKIGLYNIDGVDLDCIDNPCGCFGRLGEVSKGKDSTTGHWEIAGVILDKPFPVYQNGFPQNIIDKIVSECKVPGVLCNKSYSGTQVIQDYGKEHIETKKIIVYTSADSVLQIACHEDVYPVERLYEICKITRDIMQGEYGVGRVIARPFIGESNFVRTENRKDYSLYPPYKTLLNELFDKGLDVFSVGKIYDIFLGDGITKKVTAKNNSQSYNGLISCLKQDFTGLCFANFIDFDMLFGHRNDILGYVDALNSFDKQLDEIISLMQEDDLLIITADHGCDPGFPSTDHTREYIPALVYGKNIKSGVNLGTRSTFADIGATIAENFNVKIRNGDSFLSLIKK